MFYVVLLDFENNCPWGGNLARVFCPRGRGLALSLCSGDGEFPLSKNSPGVCPGECSGLELTNTLCLDINRTCFKNFFRVTLLLILFRKHLTTNLCGSLGQVSEVYRLLIATSKMLNAVIRGENHPRGRGFFQYKGGKGARLKFL